MQKQTWKPEEERNEVAKTEDGGREGDDDGTTKATANLTRCVQEQWCTELEVEFQEACSLKYIHSDFLFRFNCQTAAYAVAE